jgi:hypothetical protein
MGITATDINRAIKAKYSGAEWRVWFEVSQGTGANSGRRADAVVLNIWPSKKYQLHVFEVKISRADFKNEMADMTKWEAVGKYSDFFWLACPVGLVDPSEVPEAWGLIELTKGGLRIKKQAPARLDPTSIDRAFASSLLRSGEDLTEAQIQRAVDERVSSGMKAIEERVEARFEYKLKNETARNDKLETWKVDFEKANGGRVNTYIAPESMAARMQIATALDMQKFSQLARQMRAFANSIDQQEDSQ